MGDSSISTRIQGGEGGASGVGRIDASTTNTTGTLIDASLQFDIKDASGQAVHPVFVQPEAIATLRAYAAMSSVSSFVVETDPKKIGDRIAAWLSKPAEQHPIP
jgi:hypothetical protein